MCVTDDEDDRRRKRKCWKFAIGKETRNFWRRKEVNKRKTDQKKRGRKDGKVFDCSKVSLN